MHRSADGLIVVIGRPAVDEEGRLRGRAALIALAAAEKGGVTELVGSVGDDPDGDAAALALGQAGIGHAALLRDPAGATPRADQQAAGPLPRLDARDVELGLNYLPDCDVLIAAEPLDAEAVDVVAAAARYHGAPLIVLSSEPAQPAEGMPAEGTPAKGTPAEGMPVKGMPAETTLLAAPAEESPAFNLLVASYALALAAGTGSGEAWQAALAESGWEPG